MKRISIFRRTRALEVLTPEDFQPPSPHTQARFDALPDDDPWKAGLRHAEHRALRDDPWCGRRCSTCGDRMCAVNGPEPSDDDNTCCECAAEERKQ